MPPATILGDGVNVAARLQEIAEPAGIAISATVFEHISGKLDVAFSDAGEHQVKNIARPIHVWRWHPDASPTVASGPDPSESLPLRVLRGITLAV